MSDNFTFTIEIPCDADGFVLLQCPQCNEYFKLRPSDYESDDVLDICCPSCGLVSDNFLTDEVIELAKTRATNQVLSRLHAEMKELECKTRGKTVSFKAGKAPASEYEPELKPSIDALAIVACSHCGRQSKISRLLSMSTFVCPLCGVRNFNDR